MPTMCLMPSGPSSPRCAAAGPAPRATPSVTTAPITADRRARWIPGVTATSEGIRLTGEPATVEHHSPLRYRRGGPHVFGEPASGPPARRALGRPTARPVPACPDPALDGPRRRPRLA